MLPSALQETISSKEPHPKMPAKESGLRERDTGQTNPHPCRGGLPPWGSPEWGRVGRLREMHGQMAEARSRGTQEDAGCGPRRACTPQCDFQLVPGPGEATQGFKHRVMYSSQVLSLTCQGICPMLCVPAGPPLQTDALHWSVVLSVDTVACKDWGVAPVQALVLGIMGGSSMCCRLELLPDT